MVWFPNSWFYLSRKKCIVAMFSYFKKSEKKFTTRGLLISAMCHVKLIAETAFIYATKTWNLWVFFLHLFDSFRGKIPEKIFYRKWRMDWVWDSNNYKWLCTTLSLEHFISSLADKTNAPRKNERYFYSSLTLKDTEIFPKLLFWSNSWVTATVFHNRFLIINLYLIWCIQNREWASLHKSYLRCLFTFKSC